MAKPTKFNFSTVITIDPEDSLIKFFSMTAGDENSLNSETKKCKTRLFDKEFFETFQEIVNDYALQHPSAQAAGVTIVLPDRSVATDVISIPTLRRKKTEESLSVAINDLYKNSSDLKINSFMTLQNKQYTTYGISIIRNSILSSLYTACSTCKMLPQAITFAANSTVNAVQSLNPKLNNETYLLMDIKSDFTRISFVSKGRTCGYYSLPFGYSILEHTRHLAAEDMLFDHSKADLLVLNAKEKAKAKQLTMMQDDNATQIGESMAEDEAEANTNETPNDDEFPDDEDENEGDVFTKANVNQQSNVVFKTLPKKQPRRLPKYMLRPAPHSEDEYTYENFRLFVKWALNLIQTNRKQLWQDKPDCVYVNMPNKFNFLYDMVNEEKKQNGVTFSPLDTKGIGDNILNNLECYGGFFTSQFNQSNNF